MGHSMGAGAAGWYAATFPERVKKLIMLDLISFGPVALKKQASATRKSVKMALEVHDTLREKKRLPMYSFDDAVGRAYMANTLLHGQDSISRESVRLLMDRGLRKVDQNGESLFTWNADLRLRIPSPVNLTLEQCQHYAAQIDCPHLLVKAEDSPTYMSEDSAEKILKTYALNNPDFEYRKLAGGHHVHMNQPEVVATEVNRFLEKEFAMKGTESKENAPFTL